MIELAIFFIFTLIREWMHTKEVKLLSRALIAKNMYEFDQEEKQTEFHVDSPPEVLLEDQLSDDAFMASIRKQLKRETTGDKFKEKVKKIWPQKSKQTLQK